MIVQLFATLRDGRGKEADITWQEGMDGHAILKALELEPGDVKIFLVNGLHNEPDVLLKPDDKVALFPAVGGG